MLLEKPVRTLDQTKLCKLNVSPSGGKGLRVSLVDSPHYTDDNVRQDFVWALLFFKEASLISILHKL